MPHNSLLSGLYTLVVAGLGMLLGAYIKKRGENWATHADIEKLVDQVAAVTTATKEIESKISSDLWDRQRRWEVKKEAFVEAIKEIGNLQNTMSNTAVAYQNRAHAETEEEIFNAQQNASEAFKQFNAAHTSFMRAMVVATLVADELVKTCFHHVNTSVLEIIAAAMRHDAKGVEAGVPKFIATFLFLQDAIRKELKIESIVAPQSSESSVGQGPAQPSPE